MAQKKFTELPTASTLDGTEIYAVVQGGVSKKTTGDNISSWQGEWTFPANAYPTATRGGQIWFIDDFYTIGGFDYEPNMTLQSKSAGTGIANFILK